MSCSASADLSQDMLRSPLHSSESKIVTLSRLEVFSRDAAKTRTTCNLCKTVYSYKGYSTTALKRHLDTKQQSEVKQQQPQMPAVII